MAKTPKEVIEPTADEAPVVDAAEQVVEAANAESAAQVVDAPTAPSFAASKSNIAYMKTPANPMGALNTGMGYDPAVLVTATVTTQLIGGAAETIGYSAPTAQ